MYDDVGLRNSRAYATQAKWPNRGFYGRFFKRAFDLCLALVLIPPLVPVIAGLALLVALQGGRPFFAQPRVGRGGRTFTCFKLRTMVPDADARLAALCDSDAAVAREWAETQKLRDDPRTTALGRFLRSTSLDELPQVINVLLGDMSFVGPRPFMLDQRALRFGRRAGLADLRPGITGPWQVAARGQSNFIARVQHDETYRARLSFLLDLKLIVATIHVVLRRTGC